MRSQKQSLNRFNPALNLFAFAVLMAASSNLAAAETDPDRTRPPGTDPDRTSPPDGPQGSQPHFKFVVPLNLTNLNPEVKQVRVLCRVSYLQGSTIRAGASGQTDANVDAAGKVVRSVTVPVLFTGQNLQYVRNANTWSCQLYLIGQSSGQTPGALYPFLVSPDARRVGALRTGSPTQGAEKHLERLTK